MNTIVLYLIETIVTAGICLGVFTYLRPSLERILVDLCGSQPRAHFWLVFSSISMIGFPLVLGMGYTPSSGAADTLFFDLANQLKLNQLGFLQAILVMGAVICLFAIAAPRPEAK